MDNFELITSVSSIQCASDLSRDDFASLFKISIFRTPNTYFITHFTRIGYADISSILNLISFHHCASSHGYSPTQVERTHLRVIVTGRGIFRDFPEEGARNTITS